MGEGPFFNDFHKKYTEESVKAVNKMLENPLSREEVIEQMKNRKKTEPQVRRKM